MERSRLTRTRVCRECGKPMVAPPRVNYCLFCRLAYKEAKDDRLRTISLWSIKAQGLTVGTK